MGCGLRWRWRRAWVHWRDRALRFCPRGRRHRRDKSVSPPRDRFHILRGAGVIVQCLSYPIHCFVQGLIEVNEPIAPNLLLQLLAGDDLTWPLRKHSQDPERLLLQPEHDSMLAQLHGVAVQFVHSEADLARHPITCAAYSTAKPEKPGLHSELPGKQGFPVTCLSSRISDCLINAASGRVQGSFYLKAAELMEQLLHC
jgi:hypothetical protein